MGGELWRGEQVHVPRMAVQNFKLRKFSLGRSVLLSAAFLGASVVAWEAFTGGTRGGQVPSGGGGSTPQ